MCYRVYILLDIVDGKVEKAVRVLRESPGVVMADALEGPPDVIMIIEAGELEQLAKLTNQALVSVESITEDTCVLPAQHSLNTRAN